MTAALTDIGRERRRQITLRGFDDALDDAWTDRQLRDAAMAYLAKDPVYWPFSQQHFKPRGYRENLVRAAALIAAEIDRVDRMASTADAEDADWIGAAPA